MSDNELTGFNWKTKTDDYINAYELLDSEFKGIYSKSANRLCELAGLAPGNLVIELGCGTGTSTKQIWNRVAPNGKILALDISSQMIERAKSKINHEEISFLVENSFNILEVCNAMGYSQTADCVFSSFTYYYMYDGRRKLQRDIHHVLVPNGIWVFNITSYLGAIQDGENIYNKFGEIYWNTLDGLLREKGFSQGIGEEKERGDQFTNPEWEKSVLEEIGFSEVRAEVWPLPLKPSEAYRFTIEGFYKHGSTTTFSSTLMSMDVSKRTEILYLALERCSKALDDTNEYPHIINMVAKK